MKFIKLLTLVIALAVLTTSTAQQTNNSDDAAQYFQNRGEIYFKFLHENADLNQLTKIISIDKVNGTEVFAYANISEFTAFLKQDIAFELLPKPGELIKNPRMRHNVDIREIDDWDFYPSYDAYIDMMYQFEELYPEICKIETIGTSIEGRELIAARISDNIDEVEAEPQFLYTGTIHGDETTGYVLFLRLIDYLLINYNSDAEVTDLVNSLDIWINPLSNPDGTFAGGNNSVYGATRYNANNVDMNRNYADPEDGPHPDGNAWQKETVHFMELAEAQNFTMSGNSHGGAEVLNYPWDTWPDLAADNSWWIYVCREYVDTVHLYSPSNYLNEFNNGITNGYAWYSISGGRQDYMNYFHNCRELTMEISDTKLLPASQLPDHWEWNYRSLLNYLKQATYGVNGVVTDVETGLPLEAMVYIEGHDFDNSEVFSREETGFYQRLLDQGTYDITYSAPGHYPVTIENVVVSRKVTTTVNVALDAGDLIADFTASSTAIPMGGEVNFFDGSFGSPVEWAWEFEGGEPATSSVKDPEGIMFAETGSFDVSLTITNTGGETETILKEDYISVNAEFLMGDQTITTCTGIFYDTGGDAGNYDDDEDFTMTFMPGATGAKVIVEFESFDVEYQSSCTYDWLKIYDGESTSAALIGTYCGTNSPGTIEATNDAGAITFDFHSDYSQTKAGWKALISCSSPPLLPVADFEADDTHIVMGETVQFTDLTSNNPTTWAWMFPGGTPASSSLQNPMIKYEESGVFDVSLVVQNEFGSDTKSIEGYITVDSTIGITELLENGLSVFPNPLTGDILNIDSRSQIEKIELFDYSGKKVLQKHLNSKTAGINMQGLNKGIYILKVYSAKGLSVVKVSVVK
jgi:PKD repeat protein